MESYIVTESGMLLTREILFIFMMVHCFVAYGSGAFRFYVPPRLYHGFFITEFVALTAFVVWCCINEPFKDGILLACIGYSVVYASLLGCWFLLGQVMISHTKVYQMLPYLRIVHKGQKAIEGYIMEGGRNHAILVYSDELYDNVKDASLIDVRFKDYTYGEDAVVFEALMEPVNE